MRSFQEGFWKNGEKKEGGGLRELLREFSEALYLFRE